MPVPGGGAGGGVPSGQQKSESQLAQDTDSPFLDFFCPDSGPRSAGWREHGDRRRKFEFDIRGDRGGCGEEEGRGGGGSAHLRRCRGPDGFEEDKDGLPEWCLDDEDEEMGTFDASGAFLPLKVFVRGQGEGLCWRVVGPTPAGASPTHPLPVVPTGFRNPVQKGPKEPIPEEQELDFQGLEEEEEEPSEALDEAGPEAGEPEEQGGVGRRGDGQAEGPHQARHQLSTRLQEKVACEKSGCRQAGGTQWGCLKGRLPGETPM